MEHAINRFEWSAKLLVYAVAALLPVWVMPLPVGIEFGREITFSVLVFAATLLWFFGILTKGDMRIQYSWVLLAGAIVLVIFGVSTILSKMPIVSLLYADLIADRYITLVEGLLLMVLAGSVLRKKDADVAGILMVATGALAGAVSAIQIFLGVSLWRELASFFPQNIDFNVVGTINGAAIFYAALCSMALGFLTSGTAERKWKRYFLGASIAVFLTNLLLINYLYSWVVLLAASILLMGINLRGAGSTVSRFNWKYALGALFTALSIVMILIRAPIINRNLPAEVSPTFQATIAIAKSLFKTDTKAMIIGTGPGTFGFNWLKFKDANSNLPQFWSVRFDQGFSWVSTLLATTGILGFLSFAGFIIVSLLLFLRAVFLARGEGSSSAAGFFLGFAAFAVSAFVYPSTVTFVFGLFATAGLFMRTASVETGSLADIREKTIRFEGHWSMFFSSLVTIFVLVLSVMALYTQSVRIRSALAAQRGVEAFNKGSVDDAVSAFSEAVMIEGNNHIMYQLLVQARIEQMRRMIERASSGENVTQQFQQTISVAAQESQRALALEPYDPVLWRTQGSLYELLIPFVDGSQRFAFDSYKKAAELDPLNPAIYTDLGRAYLVYADRLLAIINKGATDRDKQVREREEVLLEASKAFERAIDAKGDFASAHFLAAQALLRLGNVEKAIKSVENAKVSAPFDLGVAFQLGLLYYQTNDMNRARAEFERATAINDNYSNARYFLGLIHDRQGDKTKALEQFMKIEQLNPDNQEIKKIVANLRAGRTALDGIAPPGEVPEKRKEAPVKK